ncbi:hypothetical protein M406DRAFT_351282 [Cryphonectria parasitica EP155]|uniref:Xrn1 N-terminal domain-containing protein n=1 Tax=Cryphonectria parasitica (strain ATCC 38755 / EP155) TaxID=660469 RepID=A0A9P5CQG7_CRYP1|nr:uncharacterized protein M406DRAFT_351282 [Cryphonectria parasitica EP155]KAF3766025.1 hypothetical protein M406DRAFT_351282 [Cryphonectria parasitica EP155]
MGIPAAFRWLSNKYPKIISPVIEDQPVTMDDGTVIPVDTTQPNPNGEEFDNLYLDMNGIVHPCSHPEDRPPPKDEEEMMVEVFKYTDRVVNMVRPRKLLMIAVDGVAPRAKMNQQRSRRFRAAQDAKQKEEDKQQLLTLLKQQNGGTHPAESTEEVVKKAFDSNSITPGTPFMEILAASLRYWCSYKLNTDPAWAKVKVIISDATIPGEGEHKIMNFVRSQRSSPEHDPNTRHVIYGLDADLIMLGLATHEPHFRVLREDVFFDQGKARMLSTTRCQAVRTRTSLCYFAASSFPLRLSTDTTSKSFVTKGVVQAEATEVPPSVVPITVAAAASRSTTVLEAATRVAEVATKAVGAQIGAHQVEATVVTITIMPLHATAVDILDHPPDGFRLHLARQVSVPACHHRLRLRTHMEEDTVDTTAEVDMHNLTAMVAAMVRHLHRQLMGDSTTAAVADIKAKATDNHPLQAAMTVTMEGAMEVIEATTEATAGGMETAVVIVGEP